MIRIHLFPIKRETNFNMRQIQFYINFTIKFLQQKLILYNTNYAYFRTQIIPPKILTSSCQQLEHVVWPTWYLESSIHINYTSIHWYIHPSRKRGKGILPKKINTDTNFTNIYINQYHTHCRQNLIPFKRF